MSRRLCHTITPERILWEFSTLGIHSKGLARCYDIRRKNSEWSFYEMNDDRAVFDKLRKAFSILYLEIFAELERIRRKLVPVLIKNRLKTLKNRYEQEQEQQEQQKK